MSGVLICYRPAKLMRTSVLSLFNSPLMPLFLGTIKNTLTCSLAMQSTYFLLLITIITSVQITMHRVASCLTVSWAVHGAESLQELTAAAWIRAD